MTDRHDGARAERDTPHRSGSRPALRSPRTREPTTIAAPEGTIEMTDEHAKGALSKARGTVEEGLGKVTGDKKTEATGKARQVKGDAQGVLGDVQDAVRRSDPHP
jgi:uncharacterized protein YjbJ (UPF0337 family)